MSLQTASFNNAELPTEIAFADDLIPEVLLAKQPVGKLVKITNLGNALVAMRDRRMWSPTRQVVFVCVVHADKLRSSILLVRHRNAENDSRCNFGCIQGEVGYVNPSLLREARRRVVAETTLHPTTLGEPQYLGSMKLPVSTDSDKRSQYTYQNFHCCVVATTDYAVRPKDSNAAANFFHTDNLEWILPQHSEEKRKLITAVVHAAVLAGYLPQKLFRQVV